MTATAAASLSEPAEPWLGRAALALAGTSVVFGALTIFPVGTVSELLLDRGPTQPVIVSIAALAVATILGRSRRLRRDRQAMQALAESLPAHPGGYSRAEAAALRDRITAAPQSLLRTRLARLLEAALAGENPFYAGERLAAQAGAVQQRRIGLIRSLAGGLPMIGLLGNLLGLHQAMNAFQLASASAESVPALRGQLGSFSAGLAQSFDATLLGLGLMLVILVGAAWLNARESTRQGEIDQVAERLAGRLLLPAEPVAQEIQQVLTDAVAQVGTHLQQVVARLDEGLQAVVAGLGTALREGMAEAAVPALEQFSGKLDESTAQLQGAIDEGSHATVTALAGLRSALASAVADMRRQRVPNYRLIADTQADPAAAE